MEGRRGVRCEVFVLDQEAVRRRLEVSLAEGPLFGSLYLFLLMNPTATCDDATSIWSKKKKRGSPDSAYRAFSGIEARSENVRQECQLYS